MSGETSGAETPAGDNQSVATATTVKKKFHNGWTKELETMIADWADKAACYRWMHEETSRRFSGRDRSLTLPVIILSTLTGTANFALDGFFDPASENKKYAQSAIGGLSILAGIITTIATKLGYATSAEAHRVAAVSWGKFNRNLCIEMNLNPDERIESIAYLKMFRIELDRLIDQSPPIPKEVIQEFNKIFKNAVDVVKPEITGILNHTKVFQDTGARLKRLAAEATVALHYKKGVIKQMVMDSLEEKTRSAAIEAAREVATQMIEKEKAVVREAAAAALAAKAGSVKNTALKPLAERQKIEREAELKKIASQKAGTVAALKERFRKNSVSFSGVPPPSSSPLPGIVVSVEEPVFSPPQNITVTVPNEGSEQQLQEQEVNVELKVEDVAVKINEEAPEEKPHVTEEEKPAVAVEDEEVVEEAEEQPAPEQAKRGWFGF